MLHRHRCLLELPSKESTWPGHLTRSSSAQDRLVHFLPHGSHSRAFEKGETFGLIINLQRQCVTVPTSRIKE